MTESRAPTRSTMPVVESFGLPAHFPDVPEHSSCQYVINHIAETFAVGLLGKVIEAKLGRAEAA